MVKIEHLLSARNSKIKFTSVYHIFALFLLLKTEMFANESNRKQKSIIMDSTGEFVFNIICNITFLYDMQ